MLLHNSLYSYEDPEFRDRGPTIAALGILAERLAGWRFVTVSELLAHGRPDMRYWSRPRQAGVARAAEVRPRATPSVKQAAR